VNIRYAEYSECELRADLALVSGAAAQLKAYCARHGLAPEFWHAIELAVVEGLNNAVKHGCAACSDASVSLRWSWEEDMFEARITDPSTYLPEPTSAELPEDPLAESGRGAFMMAAVMDSVTHALIDGRHGLILRKRVGQKLPAADPETAELVDAMTEDLSSSYESVSALFRFSEQLATAPSFNDFAHVVLGQLLQLVQGAETCVRLADAAGNLALFSLLGRPPVAAPPLLSPKDAGIEAEVFRLREEVCVEDCSQLARTDPLWRECGIAFVSPIFFQDNALGILTVVRSETAPFFTAAEISLGRVVAHFLGIARRTSTLSEQRLAQQRAMREMEIAAEIQQSLLPKAFPENPKSRVFGVSQAANEVGGDYFDVLPVGEKGVLLVIADVMGKGVPAALLATTLRATIRARLELAENPGKFLTEINRRIGADLSRLDMFITVQLAFFSHEKSELAVANAGHCPALKYSQGIGHAVQLPLSGVPLGVLDEVNYETARERVTAGDRFVFLTDGLYEVESPAGEMLGFNRIAEQIAKFGSTALPDVCGRLLEFVRAYSGDAPALDDRTLLVIECL
jgi:serine phosphatase RsbU (regulator of sigma subunit)/anti-sigma regulatory factor (Ser/Thr protein kinase)